MRRLAVVLLVASSGFAGLTKAAIAQESTYEDKQPSALARELAAEGMKLFKEGKYEEAAATLQKAFGEFQAPQYLLYIGRAYAKLGKLVEARSQFEAAGKLTAPAGAADEAAKKFEKAQKLAAEDLAELTARIPLIKIVVTGAPLAEVRVTGNGPVRTSIQGDGLLVELNPGDGTLHLEASGFQPVDLRVRARERETGAAPASVPITLVRATPPAVARADASPVLPPSTERASPATPQVTKHPEESRTPAEQPSTPGRELSHQGQFGALVRADFDVVNGGTVVATGLSYGLHHYVELEVSALLGREVGVEPGVTVFVLRGVLKPRLEVAAPIFVESEPFVGVRGSGGVQWDPSRHFGLFASLGVSYFPVVPGGYDRVVVLPSVGAHGRL